MPWRIDSPFGAAVSYPRLTVSLHYSTRYFGRFLAGTDDYHDAEHANVFLNTVHLGTTFEFKTRTALGFNIPAGLVHVNTANTSAASGGLGDLDVYVEQEFISLFRTAPSPITATLRGGLMMPSGRYEDAAGLRVTDVAGNSDGSLDVVTYNTQTSLGTDTWAPTAMLAMHWQVSDRLGLLVDETMLAPATRTRDNIRWGMDFVTQGGINTEIIARRLRLLTRIIYSHHLRDTVPTMDTVTGSMASAHVGGRDEIAVAFGANGAVGNRAFCSLSIRIPAWQRVRGIQLAETLSATASCIVRWGL